LARNTGTPNRFLGFKTLMYILASIANLATCVRIIIIIIIINSVQIIFVTETFSQIISNNLGTIRSVRLLKLYFRLEGPSVRSTDTHMIMRSLSDAVARLQIQITYRPNQKSCVHVSAFECRQMCFTAHAVCDFVWLAPLQVTDNHTGDLFLII